MAPAPAAAPEAYVVARLFMHGGIAQLDHGLCLRAAARPDPGDAYGPMAFPWTVLTGLYVVWGLVALVQQCSVVDDDRRAVVEADWWR